MICSGVTQRSFVMAVSKRDDFHIHQLWLFETDRREICNNCANSTHAMSATPSQSKVCKPFEAIELVPIEKITKPRPLSVVSVAQQRLCNSAGTRSGSRSSVSDEVMIDHQPIKKADNSSSCGERANA